MPLENNNIAPQASSTSKDNNDDLTELKARYDALLPKYGFLWRSMANKRIKRQQVDYSSKSNQQSRDKENTNPTLLDAIQNKRPISLNVHDICGEDCNCADPIVEIDENDSAYDEEELVDSDDEMHDKGSGGAAVEGAAAAGDNELQIVDVDTIEIVDDSDDDVILTGRKKTRTFVIESDDESSQSEEEDIVLLVDESDKSRAEATHQSEQKSGELSIVDASDSYKISKESKSDDVSSSSEIEWVELSSDEEDASLPPRVNTVIILSSDEENESDDESSVHSVISVGSSDSDETAGSDFGLRDTMNDHRSGVKSTNNNYDFHKGVGDKGGKEDRKNKTTATSRPIKTNASNKAKSVLSSKSSSLAFRKKRDSILSSTFSTFNQLAFQNSLSSVEVTWSNKLNTTAGITRMKGRLGQASSRVATIELATKVIDNEERLRSTLLHEMCHAAAWLVDGVHKPPHGKCFKKWAAISMKKVRE
jgi:hypothetical protein